VKRPMRVLAPIAILSIGALGAAALVATRPSVETRLAEAPAPPVRVVRVEPQNLTLVVRTQGSVLPRTESSLVPEVSGQVLWVSPSLVSGGFFEAGQPLLRIDPRDYQVAVERARATLQRTHSEHEHAGKELDRQRRLAQQNAASQARLDAAVNAEHVTRAASDDARALLEQAERDLARTEIEAPYAGRVREESVDPGQFVSRGAAVARIYAVDRAEVRLPIPDRELAFLDLPLTYRGESQEKPGPQVHLRADFAGGEYVWTGRIVRTEGEIDPRTRMVHAVAEVEDPYARGDDPDRPPLAVGLFVEAEIEGRVIEAAIVVPGSALRDTNQVLVVDDESRLRFREVEILRTDRREVVIRAGLREGERVCVSPLEAVTDGMRVRVLEDEPANGDAES
jgi:RND family efflux transporter MFP subunit